MKKIENSLLCYVNGGNNPSASCIRSFAVYGGVMLGGAALTASSGGLLIGAYFIGLAIAAYDFADACN